MELSALLMDAMERANQDPYTLPLDKINIANPFLFARDVHHRWFKRLRDENHTVILITHDAEVAAHADRIFVMRDGFLTEETHTQAEAHA